MIQHGALKKGDLVYCHSYKNAKKGWYVVKMTGEDPDFINKKGVIPRHVKKGFFIDDGHMDGRGTYVTYDELMRYSENDIIEI